MAEPIKQKEYFGSNLAALLAEKIVQVEPRFERKSFLRSINKTIGALELKARVDLIAQEIKSHLMAERHPGTLHILLQILGPENPHETGMFKTGYRLMPVAKFVELYGLEHYDISMRAIYEITKRHTGEYAVRPYINNPDRAMPILRRWAGLRNPNTNWIIKHALRNRVKQNDREAIKIIKICG
jgi:hypothetical protein